MKLLPTPVHTEAETLSLPVWTPVKCRAPEFVGQVRAWQPDLLVLAAYGQILPQTLLSISPVGNWNLHASLLPAYRGAAPIQYALLNGERVTGVTIMEMVRELDAGDIYLQAEEPILLSDDYGTLEMKLAMLGAQLLLQALEMHRAGALTRTPQNHDQATFAPIIRKEELQMNWSESAERCHNRVRAFSPKPGAVASWNGRRLKIWRTELADNVPHDPSKLPGDVLQADAHGIVVVCVNGALRLLELQPEGKARLDVRAFLNGYRMKVGDRLT
jgi:methionyl-tRNA formyltransferase